MSRLMPHYGYDLDSCAHATDVVDRLRWYPYAAVLLDWELPDGQGPEVARQIRASAVWAPIVMVTARSSVADRILALDAGADDYVVKPFDTSELAARLRALIRRATWEGNGMLRAGAITVNTALQQATVADKPTALTRTEFRVLVFLMRSGGMIVERSALHSAVWGTIGDASSNVLEVHLARLRRKLGGSAELIETVRGRGYRMRSGNCLGRSGVRAPAPSEGFSADLAGTG